MCVGIRIEEENTINLHRTQHTHIPRTMFTSPSSLRTAATPSHKSPIAILTPAVSRARVLDTSRPNPLTLPIPRHPKERPDIRLVLHLLRRFWRRASIRFACPVGSTVRGIVLVVGGEDCEGLSAGSAGVVRALGRLNSCRGFGWRAEQSE